MRVLIAMLAVSWTGLWFTPDQEGYRLFKHKEYAEAAKAFHDPVWKGTAWYRAGDFKSAAEAFSRRETADAFFNKGNALVMSGKYEAAIEAFHQALAKRQGWKEAEENLLLAEARAKHMAQKGGNLGDQQEGADQIVFDRKQKKTEGQDTEITGEKAMNSEQMQSLWLRRVQTKPADFLKAKFAWQYEKGNAAK